LNSDACALRILSITTRALRGNDKKGELREVSIERSLNGIARRERVILTQAISCLKNNVLRGMDSIPIGSMLVLKADVFVSSAKRHCEAAGRAGL
jgi:hypothetical protein